MLYLNKNITLSKNLNDNERLYDTQLKLAFLYGGSFNPMGLPEVICPFVCVELLHLMEVMTLSMLWTEYP